MKFIYNNALLRKNLIVFFGMFLASCMPEPLEVNDIPAVKPEIVVATQVVPDGSLIVLLTKTFGALDASGDSDPRKLLSQIAVNDAVVTLFGPESTIPLTFLTSGIYGGITIPFEEGETFTLHVESPSLGSVQATTTVQASVKFENVKAELYYNGNNDTLAQISYSLRDPRGPNWYMLNVQEVELDDIIENAINPRAFTKIFIDEKFNEGLYSEQFRVFPRDYAPGDTIAVSLSNVSQDYYYFLQMRLDNRYSFLEFISEPVNYPSNVIGGRGFFNLYIPDFRFFVLE